MKFCPKCKCKVTASGGGTDICSKGHEFPSDKVIEGKEVYITAHKSGMQKKFADGVMDACRLRIKQMQVDGHIDTNELMEVFYLLGVSDTSEKIIGDGDGDYAIGISKAIEEIKALN